MPTIEERGRARSEVGFWGQAMVCATFLACVVVVAVATVAGIAEASKAEIIDAKCRCEIDYD